jgi:hypothetical protein
MRAATYRNPELELSEVDALVVTVRIARVGVIRGFPYRTNVSRPSPTATTDSREGD